MGTMIGYGLRADHQDGFGGGVISLGSDRELDLAAALKRGGGVILAPADDHGAVGALDYCPALERLEASTIAEDVRAWRLETYGKLTKAELLDRLAAIGERPTGSPRNDELVARLIDADERAEAIAETPGAPLPAEPADRVEPVPAVVGVNALAEPGEAPAQPAPAATPDLAEPTDAAGPGWLPPAEDTADPAGGQGQDAADPNGGGSDAADHDRTEA